MAVPRFDLERELGRYELRRATRAASLAELERVVAERARLVDRERELVAAAREVGASWREIGAALAVSASQAHRRHGEADPRRRVREPWPAPPPEIADELERLREAETARRRAGARRRKRR